MFVQFFFYRLHPTPPHLHYPLRDLKENPQNNMSGATLTLRSSNSKERVVHNDDGLDDDEFDDIDIDDDEDGDLATKKSRQYTPPSPWTGKITLNVTVTPTSSPVKHGGRISKVHVEEIPIQGGVLSSPTPSYYHDRTSKHRPKPLTLDLEKQAPPCLHSPPPLSISNPYSASSPTVVATPSYPCTPLTPYSALTPHSMYSSSGSVSKQKDLHHCHHHHHHQN